MKKEDMIDIIIDSPYYEVPYWNYKGYTRDNAKREHAKKMMKYSKVEIQDMYDELKEIEE